MELGEEGEEGGEGEEDKKVSVKKDPEQEGKEREKQLDDKMKEIFGKLQIS
jgi:hypothetical protein